MVLSAIFAPSNKNENRQQKMFRQVVIPRDDVVFFNVLRDEQQFLTNKFKFDHLQIAKFVLYNTGERIMKIG